MSAVIHEVSHGYMAGILGDPTAKYEGRLTLNPIKHLDPFGSVLLPIMSIFLSSQAGIPFVFAWAKPVPYNPYNLKNQRWGELLIAIAGPISNFIIAIIFALIIRVGGLSLSQSFLYISQIVIIINLGLGIFNLIPIPPLDGSKVLFAFLPYRFAQFRQQYESYSLILVLFFIIFFSHYISIVVEFFFRLLIGA